MEVEHCGLCLHHAVCALRASSSMPDAQLREFCRHFVSTIELIEPTTLLDKLTSIADYQKADFDSSREVTSIVNARDAAQWVFTNTDALRVFALQTPNQLILLLYGVVNSVAVSSTRLLQECMPVGCEVQCFPLANIALCLVR